MPGSSILTACVDHCNGEMAEEVRQLVDAIEHARLVEAKPLGDRAQDADVGLVVDEQVDVVEPEAGALSASRALPTCAGRPLKVSWPCMRMNCSSCEADGRAAEPVAGEHDLADPRRRRWPGHHGRARAVGEQGGGAAVGAVNEAAEHVSANDEDVLGAPALDLAVAIDSADRRRRRRRRGPLPRRGRRQPRSHPAARRRKISPARRRAARGRGRRRRRRRPRAPATGLGGEAHDGLAVADVAALV